jgi:hypothetical protein
MAGVASLIVVSGDHPIRTVEVSGVELARLMAERGFEAALRGAWTAAGSLDDEVYWRQHPSMTAPSGRPDPAAQLGELRARVYSRPVRTEPTVSATDASGAPLMLGKSEALLLVLEQQLERDARELDHAIAVARLAIVNRAVEPGNAPPLPTVGVFARVLRRHPTLVFSAAAALLVALTVPETTISLAPSFEPSAGLLKVFRRPQGIADIAPQVFTGGQPGSTQRVRDTTRFLGAYYGVKVFAYRDPTGEVCLLSTAPGGHDVTVCATVRSFARSGLSIAPVNYHVVYGTADVAAGLSATSRLAFRWGPDTGLTVRVVD